MKIGFVVNDIETEKAEYTTNRLAMAAKEMGHEAWYMGIGDFAYQPDGSLSTKARAGHAKTYRSLERHMAERPGYREYQQRTSYFLPRPPKRSASGG